MLTLALQLSEFLVYMGLSNGGSVEQKLQGSFMLFDKDHNGQLERDEVITCFQTLLHSSLYKHYVETHDGKKPKDLVLTDAQKAEITTVVGALFDTLDADKVCPPLPEALGGDCFHSHSFFDWPPLDRTGRSTWRSL